MEVEEATDDSSTQIIPFPVSKESRQWLVMMKYMLQCAEKSLEFLSQVKDDLDFNEEDLDRFPVLSAALEQARHQMALLGKNFFAGSSQNFLENSYMFSDSVETERKKKVGFSQTGKDNYEDAEENHEQINDTNDDSLRKEVIRKDACLCRAFKKSLIKKSSKKILKVCSPLKKTTLVNENCQMDGKLNNQKEDSLFKDYSQDDNNPLIIKHPGAFSMPETGLGYEFFCAMKKHRNKLAQIVEATDERHTFDELLRDAVSTALNLRKKGINEDSVVTLCVANGKYSCIPYLAGLFLGCKMNAIDVTFNKADTAYFLNLAPPDILFVQNEKVSMIEEIFEEMNLNIPIVVMDGSEVEGYESIFDYLKAPKEEINAFKPYKVDSMWRVCVLLFSSGTSGSPKAICLSHHTVLGQICYTTISDDLHRVMIHYTSFYWISSLILFGYSILSGIVRIVPKSFDAERFYRLVDKYKIESAYLGPYECIALTMHPKPSGTDTSSLLTLCTGGAALKEIVFLKLRHIFPDCCIFQTYGQTEVGGAIVWWSVKSEIDLALITTKLLSCGRPYAGFWYKIVDEETHQIVGPNQRGELCLKSETMVMNGYHKRDSSECFDRSGWLKTGDLGYFDEYHCLYIVDRLRDLIKYRGWHVAPLLLENILLTHPVVERAVVVGVPHPIDLEHPIGLIILKEGVEEASVDLNEIAQYVNSQVEERKQLKAGVKIIHSIPLTATGKVMRRALRDAVLNDDPL